MKDTLEMMKTIIIGYEKQCTMNDLINEYKQKQSANIIAFLFVSNYGLITNISNNYNLLDEQDVASFCLQELDNALNKYDVGRQCGFLTFFCKCFKNRLRYEYQLLTTDIRYANFCTENIEDHLNLEDSCFNTHNIDLSDYSLTKVEEKHCRLLLAGYTVKEISQKFNITVQAIYNRNKKIAKKLIKCV